MRIDEENPSLTWPWDRLNGGQCQNKIGGAYLHHVGIAMHA